MPRVPSPYQMRDWAQVARDYDRFVFDFERAGKFVPVIAWDDRHTNIDERSFSLVSYVGDNPVQTQGESINTIAAVVGATLCGVDKSHQNGHDFVRMCEKWFSSANGENVYLDTPTGRTGRTYWYELLPNILFFQLNDLYPATPVRTSQLHSIADRYAELTRILAGGSFSGVPDFDHLSFSFAERRSTDNGRWREPDAAAAVAWLEYMAWAKTGERRYLDAAGASMRFLDELRFNPFYEILLPYGAYIAARMNAEAGRNYDVGKLLNWCFDGDSRYRRGWGVISGNWSGPDANGLLGSITDGGGYAFAMNTFQMVGALSPLARYDPRFAHDVGKWLLQVANNARLFYPDAHDAEHQSSDQWARLYDPKSVIGYEGLRRWKRGAATAVADYRTTAGRITSGSFASTRLRGESPRDVETIVETDTGLEHTWQFDLPPGPEPKWFVADAQRIDGGHAGNGFRFLLSNRPNGPYTEAFTISGAADRPQVAAVPLSWRGKLYVKAKSTNANAAGSGRDTLIVDAMAVSYRSDVAPFAQGDKSVSFVSLIENHTVPIVLYRPPSVTTDLCLYGSSHVGYLGSVAARTNVEGILRIDLLKTDFYHDKSYPTFLLYNPHPVARTVRLDVGHGLCDLYDVVSKRVAVQKARGTADLQIAADAAMVVVLVPSDAPLIHQGTRTLVNQVVVDYRR